KRSKAAAGSHCRLFAHGIEPTDGPALGCRGPCSRRLAGGTATGQWTGREGTHRARSQVTVSRYPALCRVRTTAVGGDALAALRRGSRCPTGRGGTVASGPFALGGGRATTNELLAATTHGRARRDQS